LAKMIPFPNTSTNVVQNNVIENNERFFQERYGVSVFEYLGLEGDPLETRKKINRAMQKETLQYNTRLMFEAEELTEGKK